MIRGSPCRSEAPASFAHNEARNGRAAGAGTEPTSFLQLFDAIVIRLNPAPRFGAPPLCCESQRLLR